MKIKVREAGDVRILDLKGRLSYGAGPSDISEVVGGLIARGHTKLIFNMKDATSIDSATIGELVMWLKRLRAAGGDLRLVMPKGSVYGMLSVVSLHLVFGIHEDEAAAISAGWSAQRER